MKQGWEVKKLSEVCQFFNGAAHEGVIDEDGKYIVVNSKFISSNATVYKKTNSALFPLMEKDIVMVMSDVPKGKALAKCQIIKENGKYTLNQRICALRSSSVDVDFLYYQINRNSYFLEFDNGENQTNLRKNDILNCPLLIPPLQEQKSIVATLNEAFSAIEKAKENAEKNLQNAKELFESYLQSVFENTEEDWVEKKLGDIGVTQTGTTPSTSDKSNFGSFVPFIKPADIDFNGDGQICYEGVGLSEKGLKNSRAILPKSILMVCIGASIGKVGFSEKLVVCNQQINTLTVNSNLFPKFFLYAMKSKSFFDQVINNSSQATLPIINKNKWSNLTVYFPIDSCKQEQIATILDSLLNYTRKLEKVYLDKLLYLEELKKSILQKAFNGELKTTSEIEI